MEVEVAFYSAPPGWIGRRVQVQWDSRHVRLLDPKTGQLLREHLRQARGRHRINDEDRSRKTSLGTQQLLARADKAGLQIGALSDPQPVYKPWYSTDDWSPYTDLYPTSSLHWHYILSDGKVAIDQEESLRAALVSGQAAALSIGDIVMLADYFGSFADMHDPTPRPLINMMDGVAQSDAFAGMILDVLCLPHSSMGWFPGVSAEDAAALGKKDWMKDVQADESKESNRFAKLNAIIAAVRQCMGPTRFSEIDMLARTLKHPGNVGLTDLQRRTPLVTPRMQAETATSLRAVLAPNEITALNSPGMDAEFFNIVATNGHYAELALNNTPHFSPDNLAEFTKYHTQALEMVRDHSNAPPATAQSKPIPAKAIALTAFGLHFMSDSFSSGHMRVPRAKLHVNGSLAAKMMHDFDGQYGLEVSDGYHPGGSWRAYGDDYLNSLPKDPASRWIAGQEGNLKNEGRAMFAVLTAFRQLHLMAQLNPNSAYQEMLKAAVKVDKTLEGYDYEFDPMMAGPSAQGSRNVDLYVTFMASLMPRTAEEGKGLHQNHPPLYLASGAVNSTAFGSSTTEGYYRDKSKSDNVMELHLRWHKNEMGVVQNASLNISKIYYLALYTQEKKGHHHLWLHGGETRLLTDYLSIPSG